LRTCGREDLISGPSIKRKPRSVKANEVTRESPFVSDKDKLLTVRRYGTMGSKVAEKAPQVAETLRHEISLYSSPQAL
jgi:hypothetical protein